VVGNLTSSDLHASVERRCHGGPGDRRAVGRDRAGWRDPGSPAPGGRALAVAGVAHLLGLPWNTALILGAALAPPDATAVAALGRMQQWIPIGSWTKGPGTTTWRRRWCTFRHPMYLLSSRTARSTPADCCRADAELITTQAVFRGQMTFLSQGGAKAGRRHHQRQRLLHKAVTAPLPCPSRRGSRVTRTNTGGTTHPKRASHKAAGSTRRRCRERPPCSGTRRGRGRLRRPADRGYAARRQHHGDRCTTQTSVALLQDHRPPPAMSRNVTFGEIVSRLGCEGISLRFRAGAGAQVFKDIDGAASSWSGSTRKAEASPLTSSPSRTCRL
jgi:hypothetical protein